MADKTFEIADQAPAPEAVTLGETTSTDPEAPYGRFANGKPRKSPPPRKGGPKAAAAAPKASTPRKPKSAPADFRPVIAEGLALLSVPLMGLGRHNRAFLADAAALQMNAEPLAHAVNEVAKINPVIARALSTSAPAVPYVLLGSALFNLGVQIAANHGKAVPLPGARVHDPEELAAAMEAQMGEAARQAAEDQARAEAAAAEAPQHSPEHAFAGV